MGRDGIFVPVRNEKGYKEGAVATIRVYNRKGQRLGTVYQSYLASKPLADMPTKRSLTTKTLKKAA